MYLYEEGSRTPTSCSVEKKMKNAMKLAPTRVLLAPSVSGSSTTSPESSSPGRKVPTNVDLPEAT